MKGLYPAVVYAMLFASGIVIFFLIYGFIEDFVNHKKIILEDLQAEKICNFLENLQNKTGMVEIDIGSYKIETSPLRIVGSYSHECTLATEVQGSCSGLCKIEFSENLIVFRDI